MRKSIFEWGLECQNKREKPKWGLGVEWGLGLNEDSREQIGC